MALLQRPDRQFLIDSLGNSTVWDSSTKRLALLRFADIMVADLDLAGNPKSVAVHVVKTLEDQGAMPLIQLIETFIGFVHLDPTSQEGQRFRQIVILLQHPEKQAFYPGGSGRRYRFLVRYAWGVSFLLLISLAAYLFQWVLFKPQQVLVTTLNDSGPGSLRQALIIAASDGVIVFEHNLQGQINLISGDLPLTHNIFIHGPGAARLKINGNHLSRVFTISYGITATITDVGIINGYSINAGGGIANFGNLVLVRVLLANNEAVNQGGGLYEASGANTTVSESSIISNSTNGRAGAISSAGNITIIASTIAQNKATTIGGIDIGLNGFLVNSTITGNIATKGVGGGIFLGGGGAMTIYYSTIYQNTAGYDGGNLYMNNAQSLNVRVRGTIIAGGVTLSHNGPDIRGTIISVGGNNLIQAASDPETTIIADATNQNILGINPQLGHLQDNQGPTSTLSPLLGSPVIDAILNADCQDAPTDQRGIVRPQGGGCDIGAVELIK